MEDQRVDVCIVGAGVAGVAVAQGLARQGWSVLLFERLHPMPPCLKAEKIAGEGVLALLRLGFGAAIEPVLTPLRSVGVFLGERALGTTRLVPPEAGLHYHLLVNSLRVHLDSRVSFRPGSKAVAFDPCPDGITVVTDQGLRIACRLVVLATGDARHLLEPLGASYTPQAPHQALAVGVDLAGSLGAPEAPVDSQTYHRPQPGSPIAYATFFRLGAGLRVNIFCSGPVSANWQRDLKARPLAVLAAQNRRLAAAVGHCRVVSPVMTRKVQVARMEPPVCPRVVVLGDAAHTIDPAGGGGLAFALLEVELLLAFHAPRWLRADEGSPAAIAAFYVDPRRMRAVERYFGAGRYIFALNHDASAPGTWRRLYFVVRHRLATELGGPVLAGAPPGARLPWTLPAPYLYEQYTAAGLSWREQIRYRGLTRAM